jgi:uncharacterized Zn finger protein
VRNGSVVNLQVSGGRIDAHVAGSELYEVSVSVKSVPAPRWKSMCRDCAGSIASLVELLRGALAEGVMERICRQGSGLFPTPSEISFDCSCPDYADMCKHVAAVLYGVGARLDGEPALLFRLRKVSEQDLVVRASKGPSLRGKKPDAKRVLAAAEVPAVFGIEMDSAPPASSIGGGRAPQSRPRRGAAAARTGSSQAAKAARGTRGSASSGK